MLRSMLRAFNLRLVDGAHHAWKWSSMRFLALGAASQTTVIACPAPIAAHVPEWIWQGLSVFSLFCIFAAAAGRVTTTEPPHA